MQEYLKRKRQRDGKIDDDTNIKPSEVLIRQADHTGPDGYSYVSVQSDASLMREIAQESNEGLLSPITLDFDQDSFSSELCHCYPPEEKGVSTYTLRHTPLQSIGKDGSPTFTSQPSKRQVNNEPMSQATVTARFQKLKRLHRCGWSLIVVGVVIIFIAVLVYFILE
ncbi:hypothetical protein E2C01_048022 [Portunus trituberculatus]|uniref:Uncharacterized protein n=1 Tax=Portunus trituberculatus TaxID=210409 RepID=A0A5B7G9F1_PORTR|nr:hypothetical protein [Portunus trituberculatus]